VGHFRDKAANQSMGPEDSRFGPGERHGLVEDASGLLPGGQGGMCVNTQTDHGWQHKSGALGSLDLGPEEEEHGRPAITVIENF
jgi:hypothetical protein